MAVRHRTPKSREGIAAMEPILWEWLNMAVRWLHVIAGIAWIGSSFYFVHLDFSLKQRAGLPDGRRRRRLAGARRRLLPHGQVSGGAGADAGVADLVQVGGLRHLALGHGSADHRLLFRRAALPDRHLGVGPAGLGCRC